MAVRLCNSGGILVLGVMAERRVAELLMIEAESGGLVDLQIKAREVIATWRRYDKDRGRGALEDLDEAIDELEELAGAPDKKVENHG